MFHIRTIRPTPAYSSQLLVTLVGYILSAFRFISRRLSHTVVVHCSSLLSIAELIFAAALTSGHCSFVFSSLQFHFVQSAGLFGLLSALEFAGRIDRAAVWRQMPGFSDWLWDIMTFKRRSIRLHTQHYSILARGAGAGAGSVLLGSSLNSYSQRRLIQLCHALYQLLLLWMCIKLIMFNFWHNNLVVGSKTLLHLTMCDGPLIQLPYMIGLSCIGRFLVLLCSTLPY